MLKYVVFFYCGAGVIGVGALLLQHPGRKSLGPTASSLKANVLAASVLYGFGCPPPWRFVGDSYGERLRIIKVGTDPQSGRAFCRVWNLESQVEISTFRIPTPSLLNHWNFNFGMFLSGAYLGARKIGAPCKPPPRQNIRKKETYLEIKGQINKLNR